MSKPSPQEQFLTGVNWSDEQIKAASNLLARVEYLMVSQAELLVTVGELIDWAEKNCMSQARCWVKAKILLETLTHKTQ